MTGCSVSTTFSVVVDGTRILFTWHRPNSGQDAQVLDVLDPLVPWDTIDGHARQSIVICILSVITLVLSVLTPVGRIPLGHY